MSNIYLTQSEVKQLTGYSIQSAARRWLDRNGWTYAQPSCNGWPLVLRKYHDARLSGEEKQRAKQETGPKWREAA